MVFVPVRNTQGGGGFTPRAPSQVTVNPAAYGDGGAGLAAAGKVLGIASQKLGDYAEKRAAEEANAALRGADTALAEWDREQRTSEQGIFSAKGLAATQAPKAYQQQMTARIAELRETLPPRAQAQFDQLAAYRLNGGMEHVTDYANRQRDGYLDGQITARVDSLTQDIGLARDDRAVQMGIAAIGSEVANMASRKGWSQEVLQFELRKAKAGAYAELIGRTLTDDPIRARALYEQHRGELDSGSAYSLDKQTEAARAGAVIEAKTQEYLGRATAPTFGAAGGGGDYVGKTVSVEGTAQNTRSTAVGTGQFLDATWLETVRKHRPDAAKGKSDAEILALRTSDPALGREMVAAYGQDNAQALASAGLKVDDSTLYLAHFLGPTGAVRALSADPKTPIGQAVSKEAIDANPAVFSGMKTAGEVIAWAQGKMGQGYQPPTPLSTYQTAMQAAQADFSAGAITDAEYRGIAASLKANLTAAKAAEDERAGALEDAAYAHIQKGGTLSSFLAATPGAAEVLGVKLSGLETYQDKRGDVKTDPKALSLFYTLSSDSPQEFAALNLNDTARNSVSDADFNALIKLQRSVREGLKTPDYSTVQSVADDLIKGQKWKITGDNAKPEDLARVQAVNREVIRIAEAANAAGRTLLRSEVRAQLAPLFYRFENDGYGADIVDTFGTQEKIQTQPIDKPDGRELTQLAEITGLGADFVALAVERIDDDGDWLSGADYSIAKIEAQVAGAVEEKYRVPKTFFDRWVAVQRRKGNPMEISGLLEDYYRAVPDRERPWGQ